MHKDT